MGVIMKNKVQYTGTGGGGIDYSTTEQDTGLKWIDGKTIYQKTYSVVKTNPSTNAWITLATLTGMGIDKIVKIEGMVNYVGTSMNRAECAGAQLSFMYNYSTFELCALETATSNTTATFICTIQYTKTAN